MHTSIVYEIIKEYGFGKKQVAEILKLLESESGKYIESNTHQIIRHRKNLIVIPKQSNTNTTAIIENDTRHIQLADVGFDIQIHPIGQFKLNKSEKMAQLDSELVSFPLLIRKWRTGDYFYPLGLRKKKKLARFFIDQKLSIKDKEKVYVIESDKKIVWIAGMRIDDRFKITERTKSVLLITQQG